MRIYTGPDIDPASEWGQENFPPRVVSKQGRQLDEWMGNVIKVQHYQLKGAMKTEEENKLCARLSK